MRVLFCFTLMLFAVAAEPAAAQSMARFDPYATEALPTADAPALSLQQIKAAIAQQGYSKVTDVIVSPATGIVQASARNPAGLATNLQIDPATGAILSALTAH